MPQSNIVVSRLIGEIRCQLAEAHAIANAANTCAGEGQIDRALTISLDIEELIHSANHLLQAAATLSRSAREEREDSND
jgi:hypothetical protein